MIDATSGHPIYDTDVRQLAIIALTTSLNSSCVLGLGRDPEPPTIDDNFPEQKRAQIDAALADLVKAKMLSVSSMQIIESVGTGLGRTITLLHLKDLSNNQPFSLNLS
ncbi:MAG: hypothetical protein WC551_07705 [Patescibacteria group bacterium]